MKFKADFSLDAWIQNVEVEGDSREEAIDNLMKMSVEELIENGYVKDSDLKDIDMELVTRNIQVHVYDIDYDISDDEAEETGKTKSEIDDSLEHEMNIDLKSVDADEDLDDIIQEYLEDETGYFVTGFKYYIVKEY